MYELVKLSENCHVIESPAKIGLVTVGGGEAVLIDSGNDKDAAKKVKKHLDALGLTLKAIYNTHSHADHIGGNRYLQTETGCKVYARGIERAFTQFPILEPSLLCGGCPPKELKHKFLMAQGSDAEELTVADMPHGMSIIELAGHSFDMVGFVCDDGVIYLADALSSEQTLEKYKIGYIYDVGEYLSTLEKIKSMSGNVFVPSHAPVTDNIAPLAQLNIDTVYAVAQSIEDICTEARSFEQIKEKVFERFSLALTYEQDALVGSTVRSYLTWLKNENRVKSEINENRIIWTKS